MHVLRQKLLLVSFQSYNAYFSLSQACAKFEPSITTTIPSCLLRWYTKIAAFLPSYKTPTVLQIILKS